LPFILGLVSLLFYLAMPYWRSASQLLLALPIFVVSGLYRAIFRYSGWPALLAVARATAIYGLLYASIFTAIGIQDVPRTIGIIQPILFLLFVGASRAFVRVWLGDQYSTILRRSARPKVLVYGAGINGRQLVAGMANSHKMAVVGFLDDDDRLQGHVLNGLPIYSPADLESLVSTLSVSSVLLAMPSISRKRRNEILSLIRLAHVSVRTLPSMTDLARARSVFLMCVNWILMICLGEILLLRIIYCWLRIFRESRYGNWGWRLDR
jgi:FlaA1/EpsC-like NDP-sugar epimerase